MIDLEIVQILPRAVDPLDERTATALELYCWRTVRLRTHSLIDFGRSPQSVEWGERMSFPPRSPDESEEALESLCVRFRRLDSPKDASAFRRTRAELGRLATFAGTAEATDDERAAVHDWLGNLKERQNTLQKKWVMVETLSLLDDAGNATPTTPEDMIDAVFNGEMFHGDESDPSAPGAWQIMIAPAIYHQIAAFSALYEELALGIASILTVPSLVPEAFDSRLRVWPRVETESAAA